MIDKDFISTAATKWQTTQNNVLREYLQHNFLASLYKQKEAGQLLFKGGTALRLLYQSPRFSEDLDFSSNIHSIKMIETMLENVLLELARQSVGMEIVEAKKTTGGYLFAAETNISGKVLGIKLNFVMKEKAKGVVVMINSIFLPSYNLVALRLEDLVQEKIQALLIREKPRDFFDLYFILRSNLAKDTVMKMHVQIKELIKNKKGNFSELKQFLPKNFWSIIKDLRNNLLVELNRV